MRLVCVSVCVCVCVRARARARERFVGGCVNGGVSEIGCVGDGGAGGASAMGNDGARELGAVT